MLLFVVCFYHHPRGFQVYHIKLRLDVPHNAPLGDSSEQTGTIFRRVFMLDFLRDYLIEFHSYSPEEVPIGFALFRLKKRLDKSSQELCDYVDKYIERKESEGEKDVTTTDLL